MVCRGRIWDNEVAEMGGVTEGCRDPHQEEPYKNELNSQTKAICALQSNFKTYETGLKWTACVVPFPEALVALHTVNHVHGFPFILSGNSSLPILAYIYVCVFYLAIKIFLCMQSFHTHRSTLCFLYLNYQRQLFILDLSLRGKGKIVTSGWIVI